MCFKPALISKGLRRCFLGRCLHPWLQDSTDFKLFKNVISFITSPPVGFKPALYSKRLRPHIRPLLRPHLTRFKPALISKGLRRTDQTSCWSITSFKPALISKGLRRRASLSFSATAALQASPDFKGIKTSVPYTTSILMALQASPDFKGIKTTASAITTLVTASSQP